MGSPLRRACGLEGGRTGEAPSLGPYLINPGTDSDSRRRDRARWRGKRGIEGGVVEELEIAGPLRGGVNRSVNKSAVA